MIDKEKSIAEFFDKTKEMSKYVFRELGTFNLGMCFLLDKEENMIQLPVPLTNNISKDRVASMIRMMVRAINPLALVFITEAWTTECHIDDKKKIYDIESGRTPISEMNEKRECIMIVQETAESSVGVIIPIIQGDKGAYYGEEKINRQITGRFTNFFGTRSVNSDKI